MSRSRSDGRRIATASFDKTVRTWSVENGKPLGEPVSGHTFNVNCVAFSPDGRRLATGGYDNTVRLWDADSGQPLAALAGHTDQVSDLVFSPDGNRLASVGDQTVRLWDVAPGQTLGDVLVGHTFTVNGLAFSPDGHPAPAPWRWGALPRRHRCPPPTECGCDPTSGRRLAPPRGQGRIGQHPPVTLGFIPGGGSTAASVRWRQSGNLARRPHLR